MKCFFPALAVALLVIATTPLPAQHILGTTFTNIGPGQSRVQLLDVDPTTAAATLIGASPTDAASIAGQTAYNAGANEYTFLGTPQAGSLSLYVVSAVDGSFTSGVLSGGPFNSVLDIEYDPSGNTLYALLDVLTLGEKRLGSIDFVPPGVGTVTLLGSGPFQSGAAIPFSGVVEIDPTLDRVYFFGGNIFGVSTATADVFDSGSLPPLVQQIEPDADSGALFAFQINNSDGRLVELSTAPATFGQITGAPGPDLGGGTLSTSGIETSDSAGNRYYILGTPSTSVLSLLTVNTTTLALANAPVPYVGPTVANFEFDAGTLPVELQSFAVE